MDRDDWFDLPTGYKDGQRRLPLPPQNYEALHAKAFADQMDKLKTSPLIHRRMSRLRSGILQASKIVTPADAIGERDIHAAAMIVKPEIFIVSDAIEGRPDADRLHGWTFWGLSQLLSRAQIFIWTHRVREGALAMTLPEHTFGSEGWPYPLMWWTWESSLFEGDIVCEGILLHQTAMGVDGYTLYDRDRSVVKTETHMGVSYNQLLYGSSITAGSDNSHVLKLVAFLNSRYVDSSPKRIDRPGRRALIRAGQPEAAEETVRVVDLRVPEHDSTGDRADGEGVDWKSRWWVRGHIRAQWCPSSKSHKLIWIAPYLKGPEDKEIATKVYRVIR